MKKSKLAQVRKALGKHPDIMIVGVIEENYIGDVPWHQTIDFYVAPRTGGVYAGDELDALMLSLIPELNHDLVDGFFDWPDRMQFGKLYYDEILGNTSFRRRVWLRVFPTRQAARDAFKNKNDTISKKQLAEYREAAEEEHAATSRT